MKTRVLQSYHVTHTAKELAAELGVGATYIRQIACALRKEGHHIPNTINPIGTITFHKTRKERYIKTSTGWVYVKKQ